MATVVLVEDHPIVREGIRALLTQTSEHEIVGECGDGVAALELVKEHRPDVLITDLRMPGLDGLIGIFPTLPSWFSRRIRMILMCPSPSKTALWHNSVIQTRWL